MYNLETALLELHDAGIVDTGSLRENQNWQFVRVFYMLL